MCFYGYRRGVRSEGKGLRAAIDNRLKYEEDNKRGALSAPRFEYLQGLLRAMNPNTSSVERSIGDNGILVLVQMAINTIQRI